MKNKKIVYKKINIKLIFILIILAIIIGIYTFARYVVTKEDIHIQKAEGFYFNSSVLNENNPTYYAKDWDGEGNYVITIDLNNFEDSIRKTNTNINYTVSAQTTNPNITVTTSEQIGTIATNETTKMVNINLGINANSVIADGENIQVIVQISSTSPYSKQLSGIFNICKNNLGEYNASLTDSANSEYAVLTIETKQISNSIILSYDNTKSTLDTTNEIFNLLNTINSTGITLNLESFRIYRIEFIKKNPANVLVLGTDIIVSTGV